VYLALKRKDKVVDDVPPVEAVVRLCWPPTSGDWINFTAHILPTETMAGNPELANWRGDSIHRVPAFGKQLLALTATV
jgi:hypothetical protein